MTVSLDFATYIFPWKCVSNNKHFFCLLKTKLTIFSGLIFTTALVVVITAISSQLYCFHIFTVIYSPLGKVIQTNIMISFQLANVSSVGRALHQYCRGQLGSNLVQAWISFMPHIHYCSSSVHNCKDSYITFIFTSLSTVHIYNFHTFTVVDSSLHGFIWNRHTDQLPVGSLA